MVLPLAVLAVPAALIGFANINGGMEHLLAGALPQQTEDALPDLSFNWPIALASSAMALAGIGFAWLFYGANVLSAERVRVALRPVHYVLERKYFLDDLYEGVIVQNVVYRGVAAFLAWFDSNVVDGVAMAPSTSVRETEQSACCNRAGAGVRRGGAAGHRPGGRSDLSSAPL
jgi:NADH-quinone oxidoreductase subunit L